LTLDGGTGSDTITGGRGSDTLLGGDDDDLIIWNPGDGSDVVEGEQGVDTLVFNGANIAETFDLSANGTRTRFTRDIGNIVMDLNEVEVIDVTERGGADRATVNDLTGTGVTDVRLSLEAQPGGAAGDGANDAVIVKGTSAADLALISGSANEVVPDYVARHVIGILWPTGLCGRRHLGSWVGSTARWPSSRFARSPSGTRKRSSMSENLAAAAERFVEHRRALGRKYISEEHELRLLVRFAETHGIRDLDALTAVSLETFLASRPRCHPRSFNHLLGVVRCFLDWAVIQKLLSRSPLEVRRRRVTAARLPFIFDVVRTRHLLAAAAELPDNARARQRGPTYRTIFALCYGLGLRAREACGLRLSDVDRDRNLLVVRGGKFGKSRFVPHGPRIAELLRAQVERRRNASPESDAKAPLFTFDGRRSMHPGTASQVFHTLVGTSD
jgi:site-specific recombinase XerD